MSQNEFFGIIANNAVFVVAVALELCEILLIPDIYHDVTMRSAALSSLVSVGYNAGVLVKEA